MPLGTYALTIEGDGWQTYASQVVLTAATSISGSSATCAARRRRSAASSASRWSRRRATGSPRRARSPSDDDDPAIELRPCGGVGITATNGEQTYRTTSSTGDGSYLLTGMLPGTYSMSFERAGYSTVLFTTTVAAGDVVDLATTDLTMLPTGNLANGSVRMFVGSVANLPLTGITAQVLGQQGAPTPFPTAPSGTTPILLTGLLPGTYNVRITADEHDAALAQVQVPSAARSTAARCCSRRWPRSAGWSAASSRCPVPSAVVFVTPDPTDPNAASLLITPKGTPANPDEALPRRRSGRRRGAPVPAQRRRRRLDAADVRQGLCTTHRAPPAATTSSA